MYLPPTGPSPLPAPPAQPTHPPPYDDPASPKYSVPGIAFFAGLVGFIMLCLLVRYLWLSRERLANSLSALAASILMWFYLLPMPATAYLFCFVSAPCRRPPRPADLEHCPPPPYEGPPLISASPTLPALPPGLPPSGVNCSDDLGPVPPRRRTSRLRPPPPAYPPPPPPPTPDSGSSDLIAGASCDTRATPAPGPPTYPPPVAHARAVVSPQAPAPAARVSGAPEDLDGA